MTREPLEIVTERLVLRPPTGGDAPEMVAIFGDLRVMEWLGRSEPESAEKILERAQRQAAVFERLGYCMMLVRTRDTGELIGDCGGMPVALKGPETEIGWRLAPDHWGKGYATEAARAILEFFFTRTDLERLIAVTRHTNTRSMRVMERIGMTHRGIGHYYDQEVTLYDITAAQWRAAT